MFSPAIPDPASAAVDVLVADLVATRVAIAGLQAHEATVLAALMAAADAAADASEDRSGAELPYRSMAAEVAAAVRVSDRTVQRQLGDAATLVQDFPGTHRALADGRISRAHVAVIMDAGRHLGDPVHLARYEASVLPYAEAVTAGRLRPVARLRAERVVPSSLQERHDRAVLRRFVRVIEGDDATAGIAAEGLPAVLAHAIHDRLTALAHQVRKASPADGAVGDDGVRDERTMDQLRADVFADLLLAADPAAHDTPTGVAAIRGTVQVVVPVHALLPSASGGGGAAHGDNGAARGENGRAEGENGPVEDETGADQAGPADQAGVGDLAGVADQAGPVDRAVPADQASPTDRVGVADLAGYGPIDSETARRLAGHAPGWDRIFTHPVTGTILAVDRYRPSEAISRALRVRDRHCRFVGCRQPVHRCDLDHTKDAAKGGATSACNLAHLCRRHHILKHHTNWTVRQLPGGVLEWTSPTGRVYSDIPVTTVAFAPLPEPRPCDSEPPDPPPF